ncbi:MAG: hypothetical protein WAW41_09880 [Methylobacter sp.]
MADIELSHKADIAWQLLSDARSLYEKEHYYSALNLAGAASEVLCTLCTLHGLPSPHEELKGFLEELQSVNPWMDPPKKALVSFYWAKNTIKHLAGEGDVEVIMNPRLRAAVLINQAGKAATLFGSPENFCVVY